MNSASDERSVRPRPAEAALPPKENPERSTSPHAIHVVIPTHGRPDLLVRTLASLARCELPEGYAGCVVIENGSRDGAEAACRGADARLAVRYLHHERGNKSEALNRVLEILSDGLVVFFDDDVRFSPTVLTDYAAAANADNPGCWFAGPTGVDYETEPPDWLKRHLPPSAKGWEWGGGKTFDRPDAMGFNWAAFAADLRRAGRFNPDFGPGSPTGATGQESEMMSRLLAAGVSGRYLHGARVWHYVPGERCAPQWALSRTYRNNIRSALWGVRPDAPQLFGFPRWQFRWLARAWVSWLASRMLPSPERRFVRDVKLQAVLGTMAGSRRAARRAAGRAPDRSADRLPHPSGR